MSMVICVKKFPSELGGTAKPRIRVGWLKFRTNAPCLDCAGLEFNFTTPPDAAAMAACTDSEMLKQVCRTVGVNMGKNRLDAAKNIVLFMKAEGG